MTVAELLLAFLLLKVWNASAFHVAQYVEDHTNFTTGHTGLKSRLSAALWWLA